MYVPLWLLVPMIAAAVMFVFDLAWSTQARIRVARARRRQARWARG